MPSIRPLTVALALSLAACAHAHARHCDSCDPHPALLDPNPAPATLTVRLPSLESGRVPMASVFSGFGCTGQNQSLAIEWSGAPPATQGYAIIVHDPDAPTGVGFFHWTVANLPASTTSLLLGASGHAMPAGATEAGTDFGSAGYGGPCPPPGAPHRYIATVYALDVPHMDIPATATGALLRFMLRGHTLAYGRATGTYGR